MFIREGSLEDLKGMDNLLECGNAFKELENKRELLKGCWEQGECTVQELVRMEAVVAKRYYFKLIGKNYETSRIV